MSSLPDGTVLLPVRIHTGTIHLGGLTADTRPLGDHRTFRNLDGWKSWMQAFRQEGYYTTSISPFVQRHQAWSVAAGRPGTRTRALLRLILSSHTQVSPPHTSIDGLGDSSEK
ncbi:hypothetical protein ACLI4Q_00620 [Natrialbaceae archaeon A-CW1-1]